MIDQHLEGLLTRSARGLNYPGTPDLAPRVMAALRRPAHRPSRLLRPSPALALLVATLVVAAFLLVPTGRDAIARLFGVEGSRIELLPSPPPGMTATPFPTANPNLTPDPRNVSSVMLESVPALTGFAAALPAIKEERIDSDLLFYGYDAVLVHRYPSFDLWQSRIEGQASFGKLAPPWSRVRDVDVGRLPAFWLTGGEHYVSYIDSTGTAIAASGRTVERNTLIWRTDAFFYRIETDLPLQDALRIAETLP